MQIEARGLIYDAAQAPPARRIAFFTSLCPLRSGDILCGFQVGSKKHAPDATIGICRSHDQGNTWHAAPWPFETKIDGTPGSLAAAEMAEAEPGRLLLFSTWFDRGDPQRPLFDPATEGILRSRQLMAVSTDDGRSWSSWTVLATPGLTGCATTGPVLKGPDRTISYAFESFKEYDDPTPARHGAWLLTSRDGGRTFAPAQLVARDPDNQKYFWDQRLCTGPGQDEFIALFWTHDRAVQRDLDVHCLRGAITDGNSGSTPWPTLIPGQIAAPLLLDDGRLLAFVVDRGSPATLKLWQSHDLGRTWDGDALLVYTHDERAVLSQGREHIDFKQYWEDMGKWSFGHPAIRLLDYERVLLAYYAGSPDSMSIHWARVNFKRPSRR